LYRQRGGLASFHDGSFDQCDRLDTRMCGRSPGPKRGPKVFVVGTILSLMRFARMFIFISCGNPSGHWGSRFRARVMAKRLYIGNFKYTLTSEQLEQLFERYGSVSSAQVLSDRETGRSRGFGFVEMVNDDEALAAIEGMDGQDYDGRRLTVNEARPRTSGGGGGGPRGGAGSGGGHRGGGGYGRNF
jgi:uncharacterized membrane protein YgcG